MKLLIVDDDQTIIDTYLPALQREGYEVMTARELGEAEDVIRTRSVELVLLDAMMPGQNGLDLLRRLGHTARGPRFIMFTNNLSAEVERQAKTAGAVAALSKVHTTPATLIKQLRTLAKPAQQSDLTGQPKTDNQVSGHTTTRFSDYKLSEEKPNQP